MGRQAKGAEAPAGVVRADVVVVLGDSGIGVGAAGYVGADAGGHRVGGHQAVGLTQNTDRTGTPPGRSGSGCAESARHLCEQGKWQAQGTETPMLSGAEQTRAPVLVDAEA